MLKMRSISYFSAEKYNISESDITVEDACRFLHNMESCGGAGKTLICESEEDKSQLIRAYYKMYHDEFNFRRPVSDEDQQRLRLAYPAESDVFYVENLRFRFEAGIRELDPRYARVNTHATIFSFHVTPIFKCVVIDNEKNERTRNILKNVHQRYINKYEQLNHPSYEDAQEYLEQVWSVYQEFFQEGHEAPDLERITEINKNYNVPWFKRLNGYYDY